VPLFNEEESLVKLHERLSKAVCSLEKPIEFLFIDDGSTDSSMQILNELHNKDPQVRVVQFRRNYGKSAALALGFKEARGEFIVTLDADLQDEPFEIPNLVKKTGGGI